MRRALLAKNLVVWGLDLQVAGRDRASRAAVGPYRYKKF
jgi:hypothetical protein